MATTVTFYCGNERIEDAKTSDSEKMVVWERKNESVSDLMRRAILWAAGHWPESDGEYSAQVWIEDADGELIAIEDVTVGADGFPV